ncbi:MAG TPA: NAD+ synthase [Alphaproteobacteria bacterium]|nr:NAD+ synthase [Alphaproteobacteria bacterium]USO06487.1 MAG: NAD+ synthase [Rhodospirillales bacterium]HOO82472.1 NAD+ synthase [Alphaproteobacteria bacterium]
MPESLTLTLAQLNPTVGDLRENAEKILDVWDESESDLVVFAEMALCGYPPEDLVLKPSFINSIHSFVESICEQSKDFKSAALISCPWRIEDEVYNAALLIENGQIVAVQPKHHLPNYGVFDEQRIFKAGPLPAPIDFRGYRLGILICEDMWYADVAAHLKAEGAELLIVPNASPFETTKDETRLDIARARAGETGLPLLYVNQVGGQDELVFDGGSFVMDGEGNAVFQAAEFTEETHGITFSGRRLSCPDSVPQFSPEEELYKALVLGLKDYIEKNGFPGVLLGLSGGIDSALSAAIAVDALGPERVHCVMMPSPFTSEESLIDAQDCANALGCPYETMPIDAAMEAFTSIIPGLSGIAHENMQSRVRGLILMALSNASGNMALSTGNKSEMAVGYATLYGDMNGGFNALKDLYKMQVYALSKWRNAHKPTGALGPGGVVIPENILTKVPTAELKENQRDQDSLPPYEELDDILECLIEHDMAMDEICARGHDEATVKQVWAMLDRAEYKRRQAPPGVKITRRAFGRDRRYPITNKFFSNQE